MDRTRRGAGIFRAAGTRPDADLPWIFLFSATLHPGLSRLFFAASLFVGRSRMESRLGLVPRLGLVEPNLGVVEPRLELGWLGLGPGLGLGLARWS